MARQPEPWPAHERSRLATVRDHWRVAGESFYFVNSRMGASLLVWLLIGIALAPAGRVLPARAQSLGGDGPVGRPCRDSPCTTDPVSLFEVVRERAARLDAMPETEQVWVVTPEAALEEFRGNVEVSDALDLLEE